MTKSTTTNDASATPSELPASLFAMMRDRSARETFEAERFAAQHEFQKEEAHDAAKRMTYLMREILSLNDFELKTMAEFARFFWADDEKEREQFLANLRIVLAGVDDNKHDYDRVFAVFHDWLRGVDLTGVDTGALVEALVEATTN